MLSCTSWWSLGIFGQENLENKGRIIDKKNKDVNRYLIVGSSNTSHSYMQLLIFRLNKFTSTCDVQPPQIQAKVAWQYTRPFTHIRTDLCITHLQHFYFTLLVKWPQKHLRHHQMAWISSSSSSLLLRQLIFLFIK